MNVALLEIAMPRRKLDVNSPWEIFEASLERVVESQSYGIGTPREGRVEALLRELSCGSYEYEN